METCESEIPACPEPGDVSLTLYLLSIPSGSSTEPAILMQPSERSPQNHKLFVCFQSCYFNKGRCGHGEGVPVFFFFKTLAHPDQSHRGMPLASSPQGGFLRRLTSAESSSCGYAGSPRHPGSPPCSDDLLAPLLPLAPPAEATHSAPPPLSSQETPLLLPQAVLRCPANI